MIAIEVGLYAKEIMWLSNSKFLTNYAILLKNAWTLMMNLKFFSAQGKLVDVRIRFRDFIIWNLLLTYAFNFRFFKFYKNKTLHLKYHRKKIEKFIF